MNNRKIDRSVLDIQDVIPDIDFRGPLDFSEGLLEDDIEESRVFDKTNTLLSSIDDKQLELFGTVEEDKNGFVPVLLKGFGNLSSKEKIKYGLMLAYVLTPFDFIPNYIFLVGLMDDLYVFSLILKKTRSFYK